MTAPRKVILLSDLDEPSVGSEAMRFRLTYDGPLRPTQAEPPSGQPDARAPQKRDLRRAFHLQLKRLWATDRFLSTHKLSRKMQFSSRPIGDEGSYWGSDESKYEPMADVVADWNKKFGFRYVPLVREQIGLLCSINILFLRRDPPGSIMSAGDVDNRIKSIIDALRMPRNPNEIIEGPQPDEDPFFVLMEDDKQVTGLSVETDTLLDPVTDADADLRRVKLVITVTIRPSYVTNFNLSFA